MTEQERCLLGLVTRIVRDRPRRDAVQVRILKMCKVLLTVKICEIIRSVEKCQVLLSAGAGVGDVQQC